MTSKFKIAFFLTACLVGQSSMAAGASNLTAVKGTLKNIERAVKSAVSKSEELYEQNGGAALSAAESLLTSGANPFLSNLSITTNYEVQITLASSSAAFANDSGAGSSATVPVTRALMGAKIRLIPVHNDGDSVINSWECLTNADKNAITFLGSDVTAAIGNTSFLSTNGNNGTNEYLSNCVYVADADVF